jgi:hypothetical protein
MQAEEYWVDPFPPGRGDAPLPTGGFGPGLYERYAPSERSSVRTARGHSPTRSSRIRSQGTKLACYLNGFASTGGATIIHLPAECDTLGEVLPKVQQLMHLNQRILYAAQLFLPDGTKIDNFPMLIKHADNHTAIIVGCGEEFDPTTVPFDLVEAYLNGGGRDGPRKVNRQLAEKRLQSRHIQADSVRASGHGVYPNSVASVTARSGVVASNHEMAAEMRHEYMEQVRPPPLREAAYEQRRGRARGGAAHSSRPCSLLANAWKLLYLPSLSSRHAPLLFFFAQLMYRSQQQRQLIEVVKGNTAMHKMERREARVRLHEMERERLASLAAERDQARRVAKEKKEASQARIQAYHDKILNDAKNSTKLRMANSERIRRLEKLKAKMGQVGDLPEVT